MSVAYGKLYMKDQNGNIVQIIPDTAAIHGQYQGATSEVNGVAGDVPPAQSSERNYFLRGDGRWEDPTALIQSITIEQIESLYE